MGECCLKSDSRKYSNSNYPQVYFIKDEKEYILSCNQNESLKSVIDRFCSQLKINKKLYVFIHNNNIFCIDIF